MSLHFILQFIIHYKYIAIFPVALLEGPIISIISGVLISQKALTFVPTFIVLFLGDFISDFVFYFLGRGGRKYIEKIRWLGVTDARLVSIERQYHESPWRTMIVAKVSYGLGILFMTASGVAKMSYKKFFYSMALLNALRTIVLMVIGYYFGKISLRYAPQYITYYIMGICIIVPLLYLIAKYVKESKTDDAF